jgi:hypothetical protein
MQRAVGQPHDRCAERPLQLQPDSGPPLLWVKGGDGHLVSEQGCEQISEQNNAAHGPDGCGAGAFGASSSRQARRCPR